MPARTRISGDGSKTVACAAGLDRVRFAGAMVIFRVTAGASPRTKTPGSPAGCADVAAPMIGSWPAIGEQSEKRKSLPGMSRAKHLSPSRVSMTASSARTSPGLGRRCL